ncbi:hypothetical protein [Moorena sp. SIO3H5]|uniref:hypothetical protein n=1 Tax=Moorena sp. SIO3H5 TaxID=2607834 RepID=UPI0013BDEC52|nr:hypothetical protein [Moorena sp. SIO3H5]NEO74562.1 hypothetical protein [Moorena sp. SIO3H5]
MQRGLGGFHGAGERCSAVLGVSPTRYCIKTGADAGSAHRPMRHERLHQEHYHKTTFAYRSTI